MRAPFTKLYLHLEWSSWDRAPLIARDVRDRLYNAMAKRCLEHDCYAIVIGGVEDHVHLLIHYPPTIVISDLVKDIKGATSHLMNYEIRPRGGFRWQGGYGAFNKSGHEIVRLLLKPPLREVSVICCGVNRRSPM